MCHVARSVKTNVLRTQHSSDLSRKALEPHAHVMHVRDADKTSYGTLREKNDVCGNVTLRAGLVSCVQGVRVVSVWFLCVGVVWC